MKAYLITTGVIFALFAVMHAFIALEHWRQPATDAFHLVAPAIIGVLSAGLAVWAFRLARRTA